MLKIYESMDLEKFLALVKTQFDIKSDVVINFINVDTNIVLGLLFTSDSWADTEEIPTYKIKMNQCKKF